jgi:hypothetical protein
MAPGRPASLALALALAVLAGCAKPAGEPQAFSVVVIPIDAAQVVSRAADAPRRTSVEVADIRKSATMERTSLGVSMGRIEFNPPAPELVRAVVQAKADEVVARLGLADPPLVLCGIRAFDITTPSTLIYWDLDAKIELVLRVRGQDHTVSAAATDRTYVWPTEALISNVTTEALKKLAAETERALSALLEAR